MLKYEDAYKIISLPLYSQLGPPKNKSCVKPVMRKMFNAAIGMAMTVLGNKRFNPKMIADPEFIRITNLDEKMIGQ